MVELAHARRTIPLKATARWRFDFRTQLSGAPCLKSVGLLQRQIQAPSQPAGCLRFERLAVFDTP